MALQSGLCVEQCWSRQNMDLFTSRRVVTGELNGKRRQHFDVAGASSPCLPQNTWEAPSSKRHCNGLDSLDGAGSELGIQGRTEELPEKMIIDETNTLLQLKQNKNNRICQRCLAGEPGHIKHIVSLR